MMSVNRINVKKFMEYIYIFTLFMPELFKTDNSLARMMYAGLILIRLGGSLFFLTEYIMRKRYSLINVCLFSLHIVILFSSIINRSELSTYRTWLNVFLPCMGVISFLESKHRSNQEKLEIFLNVLKFQIVINFVFILVFPNGVFLNSVESTLYDISRDTYGYFLSVKNRLILWILPLCTLLKLKKESGTKIDFEYIFYNIIALIQLIVCNSTTSIIVFLLFHVICILFQKNKYIKMTPQRVFAACGVISALFIVFKVQNIFSNFIINVLHKNVYLQGRTYIWDIALDMIKKNFLFGYGNAKNGAIIEWNGYTWYAHNVYLDCMIQGGIIAFIFFCMVFLFLFKRPRNAVYKKHKDGVPISLYTREQQVCNVALLVILIEGIFESYLNYPQFYFILMLCGMFVGNKIHVKVSNNV